MGDRVRVMRVGAPLPERSNKASTSGRRRRRRRRGGGAEPTRRANDRALKRWLTRPVYGYACVVRNERVGVKRTGLMDTVMVSPTGSGSPPALERCGRFAPDLGTRGRDDFDMYEYKKASGELDDDDEEESPPGSRLDIRFLTRA